MIDFIRSWRQRWADDCCGVLIYYIDTFATGRLHCLSVEWFGWKPIRLSLTRQDTRYRPAGIATTRSLVNGVASWTLMRAVAREASAAPVYR